MWLIRGNGWWGLSRRGEDRPEAASHIELCSMEVGGISNRPLCARNKKATYGGASSISTSGIAGERQGRDGTRPSTERTPMESYIPRQAALL